MTKCSIDYFSISSIVLKEEAEKLWLNFKIISKNKNTFVISDKNWKSILFKSTDFWGNSSLWSKLTEDKELTYKILEKNNLPIAKSYYLSKKDFNKNNFNISKIQNFKFPLIIKPIDESHGNGVQMNITTQEELLITLQQSFDQYNQMIIQEEIQGNEIRVLVVKGKVIYAGNRIPAHIIGDGINSIAKLIEIENKTNPYRGKWYEKPLSLIKIDNEILSFLKKQKLTIESIPSKKSLIMLRGNSNTGTWWTVIDVLNKLSPKIKQICIQASKIFWLQICGVDIITSDCTKSLEETNWIILELNATPGIWGDKELTSVNTGKEILKILFFPENN